MGRSEWGQESVASEGLVLRCGSYFTEFLSSSSNRFEAIAIHLYGDTLKLIYDRDFPDFLEEVDRVQPVHFEHRAATELITAYHSSSIPSLHLRPRPDNLIRGAQSPPGRTYVTPNEPFTSIFCARVSSRSLLPQSKIHDHPED